MNNFLYPESDFIVSMPCIQHLMSTFCKYLSHSIDYLCISNLKKYLIVIGYHPYNLSPFMHTLMDDERYRDSMNKKDG